MVETKLTVKECEKLLAMLKSKDQADHDIALENIKNLELDKLTLKLIAKCCKQPVKSQIVKLIQPDRPWYYKDLKLEELHPQCDKGSDNSKAMFEYVINYMLEEILEDFDFITANPKVKWS